MDDLFHLYNFVFCDACLFTLIFLGSPAFYVDFICLCNGLGLVEADYLHDFIFIFES